MIIPGWFWVATLIGVIGVVIAAANVWLHIGDDD